MYLNWLLSYKYGWDAPPKNLGLLCLSDRSLSLFLSLSLLSLLSQGRQNCAKATRVAEIPHPNLELLCLPDLSLSLPSPLLRFGRRAQKQLGLPVRLALSRAAAQCYSAESVNPMMTSFILNTAHDTSRELGIPTLTKYGNIQNLTFYAKYLWIIQAGSSAYSFFDLKCKQLSAEL